MTLREVFESCRRWIAANSTLAQSEWPVLTLHMTFGTRFSGFAKAVDADRYVVDVEDGRVWVEADHVAAITIHRYDQWESRLFGKGAPTPPPDSALALKRRAAEILSGMPADFVFSQQPAPAAEIAGAWSQLQAMAGALETLRKDPMSADALQSQVASLRIGVAGNSRIRIHSKTLEVDYVLGEAAPQPRELLALLTALL
jgi:hypothetical protein